MNKLILILALTLLSGFTYPEKPNTRVNDYAGKLTKTDQNILIEDLKKIETDTGAQVAVAIFPTIEGNSIEEVSHTLATKWKLGSKEKNDGVLLVLAMKERKMRIEVGYGLESVLTDATANDIIRNSIRPQLKAGSVFLAVKAFSADVHTVLTKKSETISTPVEPKKDDSAFIMIFVLVGLIAGVFGLNLLLRTPKKKSGRVSIPTPRRSNSRSSSPRASGSSSSKKSRSSDDDSGGGWGFGGSSGSSDSGSSSSSDSGFSGGGGDFGGGGSSGDW